MPGFDWSRQSSPKTGSPLSRCPQCQGPMLLVRISPGPRGFDDYTFDCPKCQRVHTLLRSNDPIKRDDVNNWLGGGLKPPD